MNESYRYGVATKTTLKVNQLLVEEANHKANGNISALLRHIIDFYFEHKDQADLSPGAKLTRLEIEADKRKEYEKRLFAGYQRLQQNYSKELEQTLIDFAREKNLNYPPIGQFDLWDTDKNLSKTLDTVKILCNGHGKTSLRNIYRLTGRSQEEELEYLTILKEKGQVLFDDPTPNKTCLVELVEA